MNSDDASIYCFDSSAFIIMHRYYSYEMMPDLWTLMENLVKTDRLFSHEFVYSEIVPVTGEKDFLAKWCATNHRIFISQTQRQVDLVRDILTNFPKLIDPEYEKDQADPWLIATLIEQIEKEGLFGNESKYVLVSMENTRSPKKIPAACDHYNIQHMSLTDFFNDNKLVFKIINE